MTTATWNETLDALGVLPTSRGASSGTWLETRGAALISHNPSTGEPLGRVLQAEASDYEAVVAAATAAFQTWRMVPAPQRGEVVRQLGEELRANKEALGRLVSLEAGKILSEGLGEVQEMIDICDFAVGLSRQLYGLAMHSERPQHRMYEQWHPLGPIGIVSAFNFPVAVWAWNAAIAAVCGDTMVWKPSSKTPLTAVAVQNIAQRVMERNGCPGVFNLVIGRGADGTAGQRCTTTRRLILQKGIAKDIVSRLEKAYAQVRIGDPLDPSTLMGPLIDAGAVDDMIAALDRVKKEGGKILCGGKKLDRPGHFVEPTLVRVTKAMETPKDETFAPILYIYEVDTLYEAIAIQNDVPQGLSSAIFSESMRSTEEFLSHRGSDCGIANVNIGTSGAEIGGAFGGEKETGGGRESGSDSWKAYMRRQTNTINWGKDLPLAQGVKFDL